MDNSYSEQVGACSEQVVTSLTIALIIGFVIMIVTTMAYHWWLPPDFQYRVGPHTVVTVNPWVCKTFGRYIEGQSPTSLYYKENGLTQSLSNTASNMSANNGMRACVAALTTAAKKTALIAKPLNTEVGFSTKNIHSRFDIEIKNNLPMTTAYYRQGPKLNTLIFPIEACVNPQFDGPVTFAHDGKTFANTTAFALEQQESQLTLLTDACEALSSVDVS